MFWNVICYILGLCSVFNTNTCEKHTNLVNVSTEWVLVMCWLLSVILKKYTESTVGLFYLEYLPTNDHKPQLILEITGELGWSGLTRGVLDCLVLQDGRAHSLLLLSPLPTPSLPHPTSASPSPALSLHPTVLLTACQSLSFDGAGGVQTCLSQFRHFWR